MSLKRAAMHSMVWTGIAQFVSQGTSFLTTVILARLLLPQDFGLLSMSLAVITIGTVIQDTGLSSALIHKADVDEEELSSVFWANVLVGVGLALLTYFAAPLIARVYHEPHIIPILRMLSAMFMIGMLSPVPASILARKLNFKALAIRQMSGIIVGGVVGIWLAVAGFGVWSLVGQTLATLAINAAVLWWASGWHPTFCLNFKALQSLWGFGLRVTGTQLVRCLTRVTDRFLIGQRLDASSLGYYQLASNWMMFPQIIAYEVIGRVAFPILSRVGEDIDKIKKAFLWTTKLVALIIVPPMMAIAIVAPELVNVIYGPKWSRSAILVKLLAIVGVRQTILVMNSPVFQATARVDIQLWWEALSLASMLAAILVGLPYGLTAAAGFYAIISILTLPVIGKALCRLMNMRVKALLSVFIPAAKVTCAMSAAMILVRFATIDAGFTDVLVLISTVAVGVGIVCLAMRFVAREEIAGLISLFETAFQGCKLDDKSDMNQ